MVWYMRPTGKAGEIRAFGPVLHRIWKQYMNENLGQHKVIDHCLSQGLRMEAILDEHPHDFVLPGTHILYMIL